MYCAPPSSRLHIEQQILTLLRENAEWKSWSPLDRCTSQNNLQLPITRTKNNNSVKNNPLHLRIYRLLSLSSTSSCKYRISSPAIPNTRHVRLDALKWGKAEMWGRVRTESWLENMADATVTYVSRPLRPQ